MIGSDPALSAETLATIQQQAKDIVANCEAQAGLEGLEGAKAQVFKILATEGAHARVVARLILQAPGSSELLIEIATSKLRSAIGRAVLELIVEDLRSKDEAKHG